MAGLADLPKAINFFSRGAPRPGEGGHQAATDAMLHLLDKHEDYQEYSWSWNKLRIVVEGMDAIHAWDISHSHGAANEKSFLLRPPAQTDDEYAFYVYNARYFNAFVHTIEVLRGFFFYRDPKVEAPEEMQPILDNIDRRGSTFLDFAKKTATEILTVGRCGVLVDYPKIEEGRTLSIADTKKLGLRPFLRFYKTEDIFNWRYTVINNVRTLSRVVLREPVANDLWESGGLIRELLLVPNDAGINGEPSGWHYESNLYQLSQNAETEYMKKLPGADFKYVGLLDHAIPSKADGSRFEYIPFLFGGLTGEQTETQRPPLLDIANLNIDHYRKAADVSSALFHCAHPTPIFCGFNFQNGQTVRLGAHQGITTQDSNAHAAYLELNGQSINEIRKERDAIMMEMASAGAKVIISANAGSNQTAETSRIQASGDTSIMNTLSSTLSQFFTQLLNMMGEWISISSPIAVNMNREFLPYKMDSQDVLALVTAVMQNVIPMADVVEALKNGGIVSPTRSLSDYLKDIEAQKEAAAEATLKNAQALLAAKGGPTGGGPQVNNNAKPKDGVNVSPVADDAKRTTTPSSDDEVK